MKRKEAISRLGNIARDAIRPPLPYVSICDMNIGDDKVVLVLRVGESHLAPHQNTINHRFYARSTN